MFIFWCNECIIFLVFLINVNGRDFRMVLIEICNGKWSWLLRIVVKIKLRFFLNILKNLLVILRRMYWWIIKLYNMVKWVVLFFIIFFKGNIFFMLYCKIKRGYDIYFMRI